MRTRWVTPGRTQAAPRPRNPSALIAGSKGTLATSTELPLRLVPRPAMPALPIVQFDNVLAAMEATPVILECDPSAVDLIDRMLLDLTRTVHIQG